MTKILFVTPSLEMGGAERVTTVLANAWAKDAFEVEIALTRNPLCFYNLDSRVIIHSISHPNLTKIKRIVMRIIGLRKLIKEVTPDYIVCFFAIESTYTMLAKAGLRRPLIYSEISDPHFPHQTFLQKCSRWFIDKTADYFVFQTEGAKKCYSTRAQKRSRVIWNPLNTEAIPLHDHNSCRKEIVSVGRLVDAKRHDVLIEAFSIVHAKHPEYMLKIYGEGELRENLQKQIYSLGLTNNAILCGAVSNIFEKVAEAEVFAFSSDYEGLSNALMEALATGIPCVTTDHTPGGGRELVENEVNGLLVPCRNSQALANAINYMIENPDKAKAMGKRALRIREQASLENITRQWTELVTRAEE